MRKRSIPEPKKKNSSPFVKFCTTTVACILIGAVGFTFLMFGTDSMFARSDINRQSANVDLPISFEKTIREIEKEQNGGTSLGNMSNGDPAINDRPYTPGVGAPFVSNDKWYQSPGQEMSSGGTAVTSVNVGGVDIPLYNNLPWAPSDTTFIFDLNTAKKDVISYMDQYANTGIDPNQKSVFVYEYSGATWTTEVDGVTCLGFAPSPSMVNREYCDGFTTSNWYTISTPAASEYGYAPGGLHNSSGTARKYCAVLEKDGSTFYLPLVATDSKGHTFPGGVMQTHMQLAAPSQSNDGPFQINFGDKGERNALVSIADIVSRLDTPVSSAENAALRRYIKVNIEIYKAPKGSLDALNQYSIIGMVAY